MTGIRLELHGGTYNKKTQMAVIDMQCDPERTGNEKSPVTEGKDGEDGKLRSSEGDAKDDPQDNGDEEDNNSLRFVSYKEEDEKKGIQVLRLDWRTKYACQSYEEDDDDEGSGKDSNVRHWGFFTWFIIMYIYFLRPLSFDLCLMLTCPVVQSLRQHRRLPNFRFLAELQPLRCPRMGSSSSRRHNQRYPIPIQRLVKEGRHYRARWGK